MGQLPIRALRAPAVCGRCRRRGWQAAIDAESDALQTALAQIGKDRAKTAQSFKDILGPSITDTDGNLSGLSERRS